jgi:hypothetical protein
MITLHNIAPGLDHVFYGEELYSIIMRDSFQSPAITFPTGDDATLQFGYLPHKAGNIIKPHIHKENPRTIIFTHEVLIMKKGKVKVNFYNGNKEFVGSEVIMGGDVILLCGGGHGFEIIEETVMIEVKQGPYMGVDDKERFVGIEGKE